MYECFVCRQKTVVWDADFDYSDYGFEQNGIVHECHCANCGSQILYFCPEKDEDE